MVEPTADPRAEHLVETKASLMADPWAGDSDEKTAGSKDEHWAVAMAAPLDNALDGSSAGR